MSSLRPILLADDNPHDIEFVRTAIETAGVENPIVVAADGEEALDYLYARRAWAGREPRTPAVVLLDWKMPRVDGREALRQIRADPDLSTLPVVVLTSSREEADLIQSYRLGANAYVVKPVQFDAFIEAVGKLAAFWAKLNEPPPPARTPASAAPFPLA